MAGEDPKSSGAVGIAGGDQAETWEDLEGNTLLEEAKALALYVGRHGNGLFEENAGSGGNDDPYDALLAAIADATSSPSAASWTKLMEAYGEVSTVTYEKRGVNGRSVLDTANAGLWSAALRPLWIGVVLFVIALIVHTVLHQPSGNGFWVTLMRALSPLLVPALWGGMGACTFLAKHLSNRLSEQTYERVRQQGDVVRVFLGAMIGVFTVVVFTDFGSPVGELAAPGAGDTGAGDTSGGGAGDTSGGDTSGGGTGAGDPAPTAMAQVVIAFASGLAVKPIYAAIETVANSLASRISGK